MATNAPMAGSFAWNRLLTEDIEGAINFYKTMFGWDAIEVDMEGMPYYIFRSGSQNMAGLLKLSPQLLAQNPRAVPHWMNYIAVKDIDTALIQAERLGAEIIVRGKNITRLGRIAVIKDPTGAYVGLYQAESEV